MSDDFGSECRQKTLRENIAALANIRKNGTDLSGKKEVEFEVVLPTKEDCGEVQKLFNSRYKLPYDGLFIRSPNENGYSLTACVGIIPTAENITEIEIQLLDVTRNFEDAEVFWGFEE